MKLVTLFLTCANTVEANDIVSKLFEKKLVVCVKQTSVNSTFWWKDKIENTEEVLLIMDSTQDKFSKIEAIVKEIHSYHTFTLLAYPVVKASDGVQKWVKESL